MVNCAENYARIRSQIPEHVTIVAAAKTRSPEQVAELIEAGARHIGYNYVQEAERVRAALGGRAEKVTWHMIGNLQTNKINKALAIFDVVQTVDSYDKARAIASRAAAAGRSAVPIYLEINIGNEASKSGIRPDEHDNFDDYLTGLMTDISSRLAGVRLSGMMTMGPAFGEPEQCRDCFRRTREIFEMARALELPNVDMEYLSMGMTDSYQVAIEQGSNMVRLGTLLFGPRQ
jgi:pyridoxal phosphate enzyme (YggS family)